MENSNNVEIPVIVPVENLSESASQTLLKKPTKPLLSSVSYIFAIEKAFEMGRSELQQYATPEIVHNAIRLAWNDLSNEERAAYRKKQRNSRDSYAEELGDYRQKMKEYRLAKKANKNQQKKNETAKKTKSTKTKKTKTIEDKLYAREKNKKEGKPLRPISAYLYFAADKRLIMRSEGILWTDKEMTKHIAEQWKNLSELDRKRFVDLALQDKKRYEQETETFVMNSNKSIPV